MKDIIFLYDSCCLYEIANTNYFLHFTNADAVFVGTEKRPVTSMEGFSLNVDHTPDEIDLSEVRSLILPGGNIKQLDTVPLTDMIRKLFSDGKLIAAICAAVDIVEDAGILKNLISTHNTDLDCVCDKNVITARANAYVDFGIEVAKYLNLFEDETDLQETIRFWKYFQRMQ